MASPGVRVICPKVISLDGVFKDVATMALANIGCDLTINPTNRDSSIRFRGSASKALKNYSEEFIPRLQSLLNTLEIDENLSMELSSRTTPTEEEILASLYKGIWKIYANPEWEESNIIEKVLEKGASESFRKQVFYTALLGGLRINQHPLQEDGFRINLPEGFGIAVFSRNLEMPDSEIAGFKRNEMGYKTQRIAALVIGSLYTDIQRLKFALSGEVNSVSKLNSSIRYDVLGSGADRNFQDGLFENSEYGDIAYAIFKNSKEADDYVHELKRINSKIDPDQLLIRTDISKEGAFIH
jgi:hypothetical protein